MPLTRDMIEVFLVVGVTFVLFATEKLRTDVLALSVLCVLGMLKLLTPQQMLSCFSDPAPITVAAMFVLGAGLTRTDALEGINRRLLRIADKGEMALLIAMMLLVTLVSAFINNTAVVAFFMPVVLNVCAQKQISPSRFLIPLSYGALFGGVCTLIGTSTNIVVNSVAVRHGLAPIHMFEPTAVGIVLALAGVAYIVVIGRRLLPSRETLTTLLVASSGKEFRTDVVVLQDSPLIGQWLGEVRKKHLRSGTIIGVERDGQPIAGPYDRLALDAGDRITMNLAMSGVRDVQAARGLALLPEAALGIEQIGIEATALVEAIVPNGSPLLGKNLRALDFAHRHGVRILALHRHGMNLRERFEEVPLHFGDTLLLQGTETDMEALRDDRSLLLLTPVKLPKPRRHKGWLSIAIVAGVMITVSIGDFPVANIALGGALLLVLTRCLDMNEAYEAINWNIIMLIAGTLGLGLAIENTGGAGFIAGMLDRAFGQMGPFLALSGTYLVSVILTELLSNTAVAALMTPIAISSAQALGCDTRPFIFAVMIAASAGFASPIGYQTHTMVYGAGGYKFTDYLKIGVPLDILFWLLATFLIPMYWPLKP